MRRSYLEKKYLKKQITLLEPTKSRKIIAVDFIRKKENSFSMGKIHLLLLIINYFGKR